MCFQVERGLESSRAALWGHEGMLLSDEDIAGSGQMHSTITDCCKSEKGRWEIQELFLITCSKLIVFLFFLFFFFSTGFLKRLFHINLVHHLQTIHLPPPRSACTDFQILLPILKLLGDSHSFSLSEKSTKSNSPFAQCTAIQST